MSGQHASDTTGRSIRWGILSTGGIARKFADVLNSMPDAQLVAVGSRSQATADEFGEKYGVRHRHASYAALANDPEVEVVYIATPHPLHVDNMRLCLQAGKAVLCEKPFTINAGEAQAAIALARERRLFLMEAMWPRFLPLMIRLREMLAGGVIGDLQMLVANAGFRARFDPAHRLFAPELGGGALLDVGVYPISFASMVLGTPSRVLAMAQLGKTGVDEQAGAVLGYDHGQLALIFATFRSSVPPEWTVMGSLGQIKIHNPSNGTRLTLQIIGKAAEVIDVPFEGIDFRYQAMEAQNCLRAGKLESSVMPLDETAAIMATMDQMRAQWGLRYPTE